MAESEVAVPHNVNPNQSTFFSTFFASKAAVTALSISILLSFGLVVTVGVVPEVLSDRYARLYHGYSDVAQCSSYLDHNLMPKACRDGADDAQAGSAWGSMGMNLLTFFFNPVIGRHSDVHGRRGWLLVATSLFLLAPITLWTIQRIPTMDPMWYYIADGSTGLINFMSLIFASLSDSMPVPYRAGAFATILAGFYLGYAVAPSLTLLMSHETASCLSCILCGTALIVAITSFPETFPSNNNNNNNNDDHHHNNNNTNTAGGRDPSIPSRSAMPLTLSNHVDVDGAACHGDANDDDDDDDDDNDDIGNRLVGNDDNSARSKDRWSWCCLWHSDSSTILRSILLRPFRDMSILNRTPVMRLIAISSFLSATVFMTDRTLVVFYIEENLNVRETDLARMFLLMGLLGVLAQIVGLQPLLHWLGEKGLLIVTFLSGAVHNACYGLARTKATIYVGLALSQLTKLNYPVLSSVSAGQVLSTEQGHVQGALFALNAMAGAIGPLCLNAVYEQTKSNDGTMGWGPGTMFLLASILYLLGMVAVCMIPSTNNSIHDSIHDTQNIGGSIDLQHNIAMTTGDDRILEDCNCSVPDGLNVPLLRGMDIEE